MNGCYREAQWRFRLTAKGRVRRKARPCRPTFANSAPCQLRQLWGGVATGRFCGLLRKQCREVTGGSPPLVKATCVLACPACSQSGDSRRGFTAVGNRVHGAIGLRLWRDVLAV